MNENAEQWVKALESGNYQQNSEGYLRMFGERYCCLGVGCDVFNSDGWGVKSDTIGRYPYKLGDIVMSSTLSSPVIRDWLGLRSTTGEFMLTDEVKTLVCDENDGVYPPRAIGFGKSGFGKSGIEHTSLVGLNDSKISFSIIAKVIRMEPPGLFNQPDGE